MTKREIAKCIVNEFENQIGSIRKVTLLGHYKYASNYHFELLLKDYKMTSMIIIISLNNCEFEIWNLINVNENISSWKLRLLQKAIDKLNIIMRYK